MMKIQIASDLHLEFVHSRFPTEVLVRPNPDADVLVLAGDIGKVEAVISAFKDWPVPVLYVLGNHEFYDRTLEDVHDMAVRLSAGTSVTVLERGGVVFGDTRILGTTLWTDYKLDGDQLRAQSSAGRNMSDHFCIRARDGRMFGTGHALGEHLNSRSWLEKELAKPFEGKTVVVSHHGPHRNSVHPRFAGNSLNPAFVSNLSDLMPKVDLWLHGHVHDNFDYTVGRCRVVTNPRGYAINLRTCSSVESIDFENNRFLQNHILEI